MQSSLRMWRACFCRTVRGSRYLSDDVHAKFQNLSADKTSAVTSYYFEPAIDHASTKASVRLMPSTMMYSGRSTDGSHLLRSAQYLQKELPVRIAHRITSFRHLPFIVGCHPSILAVHELYIESFHRVSQFKGINGVEDEVKFSQMLTQLLENHRDVVNLLAEGFTDCRRHIQDANAMKLFLDSLLTSRLGMRLLCEHHLLLHEEKSSQVGVITVNFSPKSMIEKKSEITRAMCLEKYGVAPEVRFMGHVSSVFPYISSPVEYIVLEILKNSMRATVEYHRNMPSESLPPVVVTIASNDTDFIIRISDNGGGIRHDVCNKIWDYGFTTSGYNRTATKSSDVPDSFGLFDILMENRASGKMHGYGFGLPVCKAYAAYLGGSLTMDTMQGVGTDIFIRLRHIDGKLDSFRI